MAVADDLTEEALSHRTGMSPAAGCLLAIAVGLVGVALVFVFGRLLTAGELRLGRSEVTSPRLWLVREEENRGLGWSIARTTDEDQEKLCVQTNVGFLLWRSDGSQQSLRYCDCYRVLNGQVDYLGSCSDAP